MLPGGEIAIRQKQVGDVPVYAVWLMSRQLNKLFAGSCSLMKSILRVGPRSSSAM